MIDYDKIICQLAEESENCDCRYKSGSSTMVPLYYKKEIEEAAAALIKCRESLKGLQHPQEGSAQHDPYKTDQLMKMLAVETENGREHYGARLHHEGSGTKVLTVDAGGLRALISYYATHGTDLENVNEHA